MIPDSMPVLGYLDDLILLPVLIWMWSLQPQRRGAGEQTKLYDVHRVSKSEGLDAPPMDYSKLPQALPHTAPE